ncbi:hypothetical protein GCM10007420_07510 [Glycocaulis albus]|uniref:Uncharacterized protein n=1 Tax=Glycocaulis albus TaxID=1382801 RepID=A0ABQ1XIF8_9PROT|nr:hypothetical protein [Glycocaulis albus]GGG94468.1 hypothetical protein GCM10007420_07510 [Glycocaulis albus]
MKRILLSSIMVTALAGAAAHAQLPDVTGQVTGAVEQSTRLGVDATERNVAIDQRTGLALDTRLTGELEQALSRHDRAGASAALQSRLDTETRAYVRADTPPPPRARVSARASTRAQYAPVRVYTRDGYYVGHVHRTRRSSGQHYVVIRPEGSSQTHAVLASNAAFDAGANAVVLAATQAELGSQLNVNR